MSVWLVLSIHRAQCICRKWLAQELGKERAESERELRNSDRDDGGGKKCKAEKGTLSLQQETLTHLPSF